MRLMSWLLLVSWFLALLRVLGPSSWLIITGSSGILVVWMASVKVILMVARLRGARWWLRMALAKVLTRLWCWEAIRVVYLMLLSLMGWHFLLRGPSCVGTLRFSLTVTLFMVCVMVARLFPGLFVIQICSLKGSDWAQRSPVSEDPFELMTLVIIMPGVATRLPWHKIYGLQMNEVLSQRLRLMNILLDLSLFLVMNGHVLF